MYKLTVKGFRHGLNAVLSGFKYDFKTRRFFNNEKRENDYICIDSIRKSEIRKIKIKKPIVIHYHIFWKDRRSDRMNIASAFDKSFQDALQKTGVLNNDGWRDVINATFDFDVDRDDPRVEIVIEELDEGTDHYEVFFKDSLKLHE